MRFGNRGLSLIGSTDMASRTAPSCVDSCNGIAHALPPDHLNATGIRRTWIHLGNAHSPPHETVDQPTRNWLWFGNGVGQHELGVVSHLPKTSQTSVADPGIRLLDEHDIGVGRAEPGLHGSLRALFDAMANYHDLGKPLGHFLNHIFRVICRSVVDHDNLEMRGQVRKDFEKFAKLTGDLILRVADWQNDTE